MPYLLFSVNNFLYNSKTAIKEKFESMLVRCDWWFIVLLAVLLVLAFTIYAGLVIWCVVYQNKTFTGNWFWWINGTSVKASCS